MSTYSLIIQIDTAGLSAIIQANMGIAFMRYDSAATEIVISVVPALSQTITIGWDDNQYVYCSATQNVTNGIISINSFSPAAFGCTYAYDGHQISNSGSAGTADIVQLTNTSSMIVNAGSAQIFTVQGQQQKLAPCSVNSLLPNGLLTFDKASPYLLTLIYGAQVGMVVPQYEIPKTHPGIVPGAPITVQPALILQYSTATTHTALFNDQTYTFCLSS